MANVKVKVIKRFTDITTPKKDLREVNAEFEATKERADYLVKEGRVKIVNEPKGKDA